MMCEVGWLVMIDAGFTPASSFLTHSQFGNSMKRANCLSSQEFLQYEINNSDFIPGHVCHHYIFLRSKF
jgi:hypothetical protein